MTSNIAMVFIWDCVFQKVTLNMDLNIEKECSALGGMFQQIMNDMKVCHFV